MNDDDRPFRTGQTKADAVYVTLRDAIVGGRLPAETPLRQERIARELGVSATPVREAFRRLEAEGFVRHDPHRGVVVRDDPGRDEIDFGRLCDLWAELTSSSQAVPGSDFP